MVRYSFLVRLSHPLLHAGFIPALSLITLFARDRDENETKGDSDRSERVGVFADRPAS
jgi:hypothetical protein